jgi:uncharacterized protein with HEPN domain
MIHDPKIFVMHILDSIELLKEYTRGVTKEEFIASTKIQDSIVRRIEIIGEATKNLSKDWKASHQEIPWKDLAGMRDVVIHGYFKVNHNLTWHAATVELPNLEQRLRKLLDV